MNYDRVRTLSGITILSPLQSSTGSSDDVLRHDRRHGRPDVRAVVGVPLHQRGHVELGLLDDLDLPDVAVLDGEYRRRLPLDLLPRGPGDEGLDEGLEVPLPGQRRHGPDHLGADGSHLGRLGVACLLDLVVLLLREGDAEHAHDVPVRGPGVDVRLDDALLLLDEAAQLVAGHVHAVEVEEAVEALDVLDAELDLAVGHGLVVVEVAEGQLDDAPEQAHGRDLGPRGLGDDGLAALLLGEDGGRDKLVPLLLGEGVHCLLLASLLRLCESLVLSLLYVCFSDEGGGQKGEGMRNGLGKWISHSDILFIVRTSRIIRAKQR